MHSCIYRGYTEHRRLRPREHNFRYPISWLYLDLDEVPGLYDRLRWLSRGKFAPLSFRAEDHLGKTAANGDANDDSPSPSLARLKSSVRKRVLNATGEELGGPIRLLTPLRQFGRYFSPICLYYCFDSPDTTTAAAIAVEVTNTPWREKHWYVLGPHNSVERGPNHFRSPKNFHVSPFMKMGLEYDWSVVEPAESLRITIRAHEADAIESTFADGNKEKPLFVASLDLQRKPLNDATLVRMLLRYPLFSLQALAAIQFEAARLWLKKVPYIPHPNPPSHKRAAEDRESPPSQSGEHQRPGLQPKTTGNEPVTHLEN